MPIDIRMPALSPTMERGTLARWLVKAGDEVKSGDILAEIETDKATMEFEAVDEGTVASIAVPEGSEGVAVGTVIAVLAGEDEDEDAAPLPVAARRVEAGADAAVSAAAKNDAAAVSDATTAPADPAPVALATPAPPKLNGGGGARVIASPLARRIAAERGVDLAAMTGSGPHGRIVKADVERAGPGTAKPAAETGPAAAALPASVPAPAPASPPPAAEPLASSDAAPGVAMAEETRAVLDARVPHTVEKLSGMRKTIARRLVQSKQEAPHIYLGVDVQIGRLLALRAEVNAALAARGIKVSVNDMLVKALARALIAVPECNVAYAASELIRYSRADISVAVSIPGGLITPIVRDADGRSLSSIARATKDFAGRAREGKLKPEEYQGGTASLSNMGMMGIKQFSAVINPPQGMILAVGAGEKRAWAMADGTLGIADVMTATGSFDHRAIDGADGARLMDAFRSFVEAPLGMLA